MGSRPIRRVAAKELLAALRLVDRVKRLASVKATREAVHIALDRYVRSRDYSALIALRGSGGVAEGYDPKDASPAR